MELREAYQDIRFGWTWTEGEDDEQGKSWITVGPLDDEGYVEDELAVIVHRDWQDTGGLSHARWEELRAWKERDATLICDALNAYVAPERSDS